MILFGGPSTRTADAGVLARAWSRPLGLHIAALALVLLALVPVVGTSSSFSTDEGAAIAQAESLAGGGGWLVEHPVPEVDPDGRHYPLELAERGPRGWVAYGKHPVYALLLAGASHAGGVAAMVLLSLAGTVVAAALAAALARRLDPGLARPTLWTVGLATPLLFDGYLVMAHTLGAAFGAGAVLAAVVALERRSPAFAVLVTPLMAGAVLMRNEAAFLAMGLALAAGAVVAFRRDERRPAAVIFVGALAAGAGAHLVETWWLARILGAGSGGLRSVPAATEPGGFLSGRAHAFLRTVVLPTHGGDRLTTLLLVAMLLALACGAVTARRDPSRPGPVLAYAGIAASAALLALVVAHGTVVSGLLAAFPVAGVGVLLIRRTTLRTPAARIAFGSFAVFAAGVVAAQYTVGGSVEWGGRFFAVGLPLLAPVILLALKEHGARLPAQTARRTGAALVVCSLAVGTMGVASLRHQHRRLGQLMALAEGAGRRAAAPGQRPVMIATYGSVARWAWLTAEHQRWLTTEPADLPDLLARLGADGVAQVALVTPDVDRDVALVGSGAVVSSEAAPLAHGWHVLVVSTGGA